MKSVDDNQVLLRDNGEQSVSRFLLLILLTGLVSGCATHTLTSGRIVLQDEDNVIDVSISDRDRVLIRDYYKKYKKKKKRKGLLPGLAKRDTLPPGLRGEPLPRALENTLSPLPSSYVRVVVGQDIVLMNKKTRVVLEVIYGAAY
ncbi:MAG: hypothetical protein BMS9Abin22_617 [Gammaproteobacteria bacterium]|nr:MAG: hypothetical protein BMS9Abin22_617 [Gammaproteobacteria bacterium]